MKKFTSAEYALFHRITSVSAAPGEKWAWAETTVAPDESEQSRVHIGGGASFPGRFPRWSPSGRTLAWLGADENGAEQLWLCAPDGSDARMLTHLRHGMKRFSWAADESELAFEADLWDGEPAFGSEGLDQWKAEQALAPQCSEVLFCKLDDAHGMFPPCTSRIGVVSVRTGETAMLDTLGLVKLGDNLTSYATVADIVENPLNLNIVELDAAMVGSQMSDSSVAAGFMNGQYATQAGYKHEDAIAVEAFDPDNADQHGIVNIIAAREADAENPVYLRIAEAYQCDEVKEVFDTLYAGSFKAAW
mgnify:CR=1 FL=1